ncbi:helix-turn-helix domain-containing protein [Tellurirhabdus bombi]|uniref:helix-turn-helix domain-containing protein n=1 Tax=Tellurirhabdus bombi TaxID=2907205 RepID=UPI001F1AEB0C|nr:helix-turn-helix domain-containing protein [Tellurirhabdus bombi]
MSNYSNTLELQTVVKSDRLKELREYLGVNQEEMSKRIETTQSNYSGMETGRRPIGKRISKEIISAFELNPDWFETGEGEMFLKGKQAVKYQNEELEKHFKVTEPHIPFIDDESSYEMVTLPYVSVPLRASFAEMSDPEANYGRLSRIQVRVYPGEDTKGQIVFAVNGDSMEPRLPSGTKVRCKKVLPEDWPYISSGVYAVSYANSFVIKRVKNNELLAKGYLTLHSDNTETGGSSDVPANQIQNIWKVLRVVDAPVL